MKTRSAISVGIAVIVLLSVLGITLSSSDASHDPKLRIAYFPNIGHAIPIVGIEKGFFQNSLGDQIKIETKVFDSGPQAIEALFANSIDIAYVGPGPAINGFLNSENHNIKILAGAASARIDIIRGLSSIEGFEGVTGRLSADKDGDFIRRMSVLRLENGHINEVMASGVPRGMQKKQQVNSVQGHPNPGTIWRQLFPEQAQK